MSIPCLTREEKIVLASVFELGVSVWRALQPYSSLDSYSWSIFLKKLASKFLHWLQFAGGIIPFSDAGGFDLEEIMELKKQINWK